MSVKPKHFSEIYQDASSLAKGITKVSNHELLACGKCNEPIRVLMENESISNPRLSGGVVKFCVNCGTEIDWSEIRKNEHKDWREYENLPKDCDVCKMTFYNEESFCIHCGKSLKERDRTQEGF